MRELVERRLREIARRAGVTSVPTPVLVAGFVLLSVALVAALVRWWPQPTAEGAVVVHTGRSQSGAAGKTGAGSSGARGVSAGAPAAGSLGANAGGSAPSAGVCVHVVGAVHHPGVYSLRAGSRAESAVDAAGGFTMDAVPSAINLAALLQDGQQVVVPSKKDVAAGTTGVDAASPTASAGAPAGGAHASTAVQGKVNINTADAIQLDALPGVGPSTAAKIVADRQDNGPFRSADDLGRVPGIGPKKLDQLKPLVCVR